MVAVDAGQPAYFDCQIRSHELSALSTIAFLVRLPDSDDLTQCLSCYFSMTQLTMCSETVDEGSCSGLQFFNTSFGNSNVLTHNLTAHWSQVDMHHNGYEVVCAIAVGGITQWAHTATLTVVPAPTLTPTSENGGNFQRQAALILISCVLLVIIASACVVGLILLYRHKTLRRVRSPNSIQDDIMTFVKFKRISSWLQHSATKSQYMYIKHKVVHSSKYFSNCLFKEFFIYLYIQKAPHRLTHAFRRYTGNISLPHEGGSDKHRGYFPMPSKSMG